MIENPLANGYVIRAKYKVIKEDTTVELEIKVNELLNEGWNLQGGVSTVGTYVSYVQALVREVMERENA